MWDGAVVLLGGFITDIYFTLNNIVLTRQFLMLFALMVDFISKQIRLTCRF